ncbi:MAG: RNA-binding S4 domain-containing protein [Bacteroidales bacterium]|nr:RNA-binding S4 domain-containing protein [Bacteroidales bacterium]
MRNNESSHNWDRQSRDENPRRGSQNRRPSRDDNRQERSNNRPFNRTERREKPFNREERGERTFSRGDRRPERQERSFNRNDRGFNRNENRGERPFNRERRSNRNFNREDNNFQRNEYRAEGERQRRPRIRKGFDDFQPREQKKKNFSAPKPENEGKTRLNKFIANAGICSRREADVLISTGVITVNGEVITEMGYKVVPGDVVKYNGRELKDEKKVYILLNKPKGYITTADDPQQRNTVMELIEDACSERIYPVGRLDRNTTGLLLFTNDGELTKKLTHPSFGAQKVYNVELDHTVSRRDLDTLLDGVELEDGLQKVDNIDYSMNEPIDRRKVGVSIHSGKNRIVRRLFESLGYEVVKLDRVYFAGLTKKNLLRGQYRFLTEKEIAFLKMDK